MKVFISWSGGKSQSVAKILKQWIPCVIQSVEPYFSSADIDKGARWSSDIAKELQDASFGILCVTRENLNSAWLNFEAGALSKSIDQSKVCPFLVDLKPSDIQNSPILQFQMASSTKDDLKKLFASINSNIAENRLDDNVLTTTFDTFWPKIEEELNATTDTGGGISDNAEEQKPIEEILELVRYQHRLLKNPEELLPPDYIINVFRRSEKMIPRGFWTEIEEYTYRIARLSQDICKECSLIHEDDLEGFSCSKSLLEIRELAERLGMVVNRAKRNNKLIY